MKNKLTNILFSGFLLFILSCKDNSSDAISFIETNPTIDGKLDTSLKKLKKRAFKYIWQFDNPVTDTVTVYYRMGYTPSHMYIHIEAETDSINYRPRGFVNGDGFKFLLAKPQVDSLTNEYYDMVFSASKDKSYWARKRIWDYNHNQRSNKAFSTHTKFEESSNGKKSDFEALVAWKDIPPYHPFFIDSIGFNLYFAKAIGDTITNGYSMVDDDGIWNEELPKRKYLDMQFERPKDLKKDHLLSQLKRKNIVEGQNLHIEIIALSPKDDEIELDLVIKGNDQTIKSSKIKVKSSNVFIKTKKELITQDMSYGIYNIVISKNLKKIDEYDFMILPKIDLQQIKKQIEENSQNANEGTKHTLLYKLEQYEKLVLELRPYESNPKLLKLFSECIHEFKMFMNGLDPYENKEEPYRRAFLS